MKKLRKFVTLGHYYTSTTVEGVVTPHDFSPFLDWEFSGGEESPAPSLVFFVGGGSIPQLFFFEPLHFPSRLGKQTMRASLQSGKTTLTISSLYFSSFLSGGEITRPLLRFGFPGEGASPNFFIQACQKTDGSPLLRSMGGRRFLRPLAAQPSPLLESGEGAPSSEVNDADQE